jgi:hypothetical protein
MPGLTDNNLIGLLYAGADKGSIGICATRQIQVAFN